MNNYDSTVAELTRTPNDPALQHRAVLALARAGSLDFAWAEYRRYGLDGVTAHPDAKLLEDIMGLGARLLKDLFLASSGKSAKDYALQSAEKYETAFKLTKGFYSGINAATMALMGGMPEAIITDRAKDILRRLPPPETPDKETLYFIEATRAEALLILGKAYKSRAALRIAVRHDPQNYTAHASTLRQFKMILGKRGEDASWLSAFSPPKPVHFAGHLFKLGAKTQRGTLSLAAQDTLKIEISDTLQINDIGFGYGALAAGADIIIAEVLLDEGCELHATLPVEPDIFIQHSVAPYGAEWTARFQKCWERASSRNIVTHSTAWPRYETDRFSGNVAMGKAILQAAGLSVEALQLLVCDGKTGDKGTARNAADWASSGREQRIVTYPGPRLAKAHKKSADPDAVIQATLFKKGDSAPLQFSDIYKAAEKALRLQKQNEHEARLGLHIEIGPQGQVHSNIARQLAAHAVPGGILISEAVVSFLLLEHEGKFEMDYMGRLAKGIGSDKDAARAFALKRKG